MACCDPVVEQRIIRNKDVNLDQVTPPQPATLAEALARRYPFAVLPEPTGGFDIVFPDLPGCTSHSRTLQGIGEAAAEASSLWLRGTFDQTYPIPAPSDDWDPSPLYRIGLERLDGQPKPDPKPIYTAEYVAGLLDLSPNRVRQIARSRTLGQMVADIWMFTPEDVVAMQDRPGRGRPSRAQVRDAKPAPANAKR